MPSIFNPEHVALALLLYALAAIGLAYIIGQSEISYGPRLWLADRGPIGRFLVALVECPICLGTWVGLLAGLTIAPLAPVIVGPWWIQAPVTALVTAGSNLLLSHIANVHPYEEPTT